MAREFSRTDRVGQQIHKEMANLLQNEFQNRDPRLGMVTVSGAEVSRDLSYAKIFLTFYDNEDEQIKEKLKILDDNKGFIRSLLAKRIRMRAVPSLRFVQDKSITEGMRISNLVTDVVNKDNERAKKFGTNSDSEGEE